MEDHPIPQNVTSFEFHLVGDMTLKQFGYLGTGLTIAFLSYMAIMPINAVLGIFLIFISASLGASFAFLPLSDRPLEHWVKAFFKATYSPTQGSWVPSNITKGAKKVKVEAQDPLFTNRLAYYLASIGLGPVPQMSPTPPKPQPTLPLKRLVQEQPAPKSSAAPLSPAHPGLQSWVSPAAFTEEPKLPSAQELNQLVSMARQAQILQTKVTEIERQINQLKMGLSATKTQPGPDTTTLEKTGPSPAYTEHFQQMVENLQSLVQQTEHLHHQNEAIQKIAPRLKPAHIVVVQPPPPAAAKLLLTSFPNVINGIITDTAGNYLEGVIVIIHNKEGIPVRALKTNKLGQFAGATPLPSGVYTVILEKDNLEFDTLQITLGGEVLPPLSIRAKKGGGR